MPKPSLDDRLSSLLEEYGHVLRRAIQRVAPREMEPDIDDIEQEARMRVWRALRQKTELEQPASYLYRVAVNATLNAVRKRQARRELPLDPPEDGGATPVAESDPEPSSALSPEANAARRQQLAAVRAAMAGLAENRRRAVGLHLQGFTTREIGELYGWTEAKARNLAYRGLDELRRRLESQGESLDRESS